MVEPITSTIWEWLRARLVAMGLMQPTWFEYIQSKKASFINKHRVTFNTSLLGRLSKHDEILQAEKDFKEFEDRVWATEDSEWI